jgi:hypothetical protein
MTAKAKPSAATALKSPVETPIAPWLTPPCTTDERLRRIEAMLRQIDGYVQFMCAVEPLPQHGSSTEARERAVAAFYDRMVILERQLARIQEELRLG